MVETARLSCVGAREGASPDSRRGLTEHAWDAAADRYFVVDAATGETTTYAAAARAYTGDEYRELLSGAGFASVELLGPLGGVGDGSEDFFAIVACTAAAAA